MDRADGTPYVTSYAEVLSYFDPAYLWRATGARTAAGKLIAFGLTRMPSMHGPSADVLISGGVHPAYRGGGYGRKLLALQLQTAEQLAQGEVEAARACMHVDSGQEDLMDMLRRHGFEDAYAYVQLRRPLTYEVELVVPPKHISIERLEPALDEEVRKAHNAIFLELAGQSPVSLDQWASERAFLERNWSFVAMDRRGDRPRLAGYVLSGRYEQDWQEFGYSEGYIDEVAVQNEWSEHDLISTLLGTAMNAYQAAGIDYAGMDVTINPAAASPWSELELYEALGFEQTGQTYVLAQDLYISRTNI